MKTHLTSSFLLVALLSTSIFSIAQRGGRDHDNGASRYQNRNNYTDQHQGRFTASPADRGSNNSFHPDRSSTFTPNVQPRGNSTSNVFSGDRGRTFQPYTGGNISQRGTTTFNQQRVVSNNVTLNNSTHVNSYGYNGYPRGGYAPTSAGFVPRRYEYAGAPRYAEMPRGSRLIHYGGYPFYYNRGLFYGYNNGFYEPVFAPIGIHVSILPASYYPIYIGARRYYYYEGTYYWENGINDYEVVDAPLGAVLPALPSNATIVMVNGEQFYEFNGTYYKQGVNSRNQVVYTVVGKYGSINNTGLPGATAMPQELRVGDVISILPNGSKQVTIDGETLYVSPDNTYFRTQNDGNTINYVVVGTQQPN